MRTMLANKDWFDIAFEHHDDQNYSQAVLAIEKYLEINPGNKNGKLLKAMIYRDLSNYKLVLSLLEEIKPTKKSSKDYAKVYYIQLGNTYKGLGRFNKALKWYDKVIENKPDETVGYIYKGACLASIGKYELAKKEYLKATKLSGDPDEAFYNLALISRAEMKFEEAKEYCEKSLEIDPNMESVIHCYKDILEAIKMTKEIRKKISEN